MQEHTKQKFAFTQEAVKQLITLSTAIIGVTVTFKDKILPSSAADAAWLLVLALCAFVFSAFKGIRTLYGVARVLEDVKADEEPSIVWTPMIRDPATEQIRGFVTGLGLLVAYFAATLILAR